MSNDTHNPSGEHEGVFEKSSSVEYRQTCKSCDKKSESYHGNRWDAHHILPGVVFSNARSDDPNGFIIECLNATEYDINAAYSLAGMPKLTAFILYFQRDRTMPKFDASKEKTVTMRRWGKVKKYKSQKDIPIAFPGDIPVHNPVNWGHTQYNEDVDEHLTSEIWNALRKKKKKKKAHFKPEDLKDKLTSAKDKFWKKLLKRGKGPGFGEHKGIEANLRHRYDRGSEKGWWQPLCMAKVDMPTSPSLL